MKRLSAFLQQHQFVVPNTTEPNFAFIKRDMAKLKKGISQIVDDIIKENEPPEEEPSPPVHAGANPAAHSEMYEQSEKYRIERDMEAGRTRSVWPPIGRRQKA